MKKAIMNCQWAAFLCLVTVAVVVSYPVSPGTCGKGPAIAVDSDMNHGDAGSGEIFFEGILLSLNGFVMIPSAPTTVPTDETFQLTIESRGRGGVRQAFRGFLYRLSANDGETDVSDTLSIVDPESTRKLPNGEEALSVPPTCAEKVSGLGHRNRLDKTNITVDFRYEGKDVDLLLEVTVVIENEGGGQNSWVYSQFPIRVRKTGYCTGRSVSRVRNVCEFTIDGVNGGIADIKEREEDGTFFAVSNYPQPTMYQLDLDVKKNGKCSGEVISSCTFGDDVVNVQSISFLRFGFMMIASEGDAANGIGPSIGLFTADCQPVRGFGFGPGGGGGGRGGGAGGEEGGAGGGRGGEQPADAPQDGGVPGSGGGGGAGTSFFQLPSHFQLGGDNEPVPNRSFESIATLPSTIISAIAMEQALQNDGDDTRPSRIAMFDLRRRTTQQEYVYMTDETPQSYKETGLVGLLSIDDFGTLLTLERSAGGPNAAPNALRLYETNTNTGVNVQGQSVLPEDFDYDSYPMEKDLVVDFVEDLELGVNFESINYYEDNGSEALVILAADAPADGTVDDSPTKFAVLNLIFKEVRTVGPQAVGLVKQMQADGVSSGKAFKTAGKLLKLATRKKLKSAKVVKQTTKYRGLVTEEKCPVDDTAVCNRWDRIAAAILRCFLVIDESDQRGPPGGGGGGRPGGGRPPQ